MERYLKCPNMNTKIFTCYNSLHARGEFRSLSIAFANSLNPDEDQHNVGIVLDPNCLTLRWCSRVVYL